MTTTIQRFACTACGKCCNRSPEVEMSEAAGLADVFVFRLMFRLYWLLCRLADYQEDEATVPDADAFYERKRLLSAFAARRFPARVRGNAKTVEYTKYLMISALALDTSPGRCSALDGRLCGIYERRPLACRTVPFHYARAEALAESDLQAFVTTPGYRCDTSDSAGVMIESGRIMDAGVRETRARALALAASDRRWAEAITRRMAGRDGLPSLRDIEANAPFGASTIPMRVAWQIAAYAGLIGVDQCQSLVAKQLATIERELAAGICGQDARDTLLEMRAEYRHHLENDRHAIAAIC